MFKILILLFYASTVLMGYVEYFDSPAKRIDWQDIIDLKEYDKNYTPQGLVFLDHGVLALSIHSKSKFSKILLFDISKGGADLIKSIMLPKDATHTSDLEYFNGKIYALDYHSNKIYIIDKEEIVNSNSISFAKEIKTNLSGSGSACIINLNDKHYYVLTRFLRSDKLHFIPIDDIYDKSELSNKDIEFTINANHFIQGMACRNNQIIISANTLGEDIIYIYHIIEKKLKLLNTINAPTYMVEDIAFNNEFIFTSGESKDENIVYKARIDEI